jgi:hypothetical protein
MTTRTQLDYLGLAGLRAGQDGQRVQLASMSRAVRRALRRRTAGTSRTIGALGSAPDGSRLKGMRMQAQARRVRSMMRRRTNGPRLR